ncbi:hypothetical protein BT96DRAFT_825397 [Gymnopus androsaceus JB14]|uniref:CHAT domain-containing protein n=1 Tax=Gymnopus androsaceus JB14 TaxID=1447944 RepID=A0A6A4HDY2_9AGAR|nr:hypothetical protein BT96DRAFT_825397 [Gymnopus androsaceus JB14]
MHLQFYLPESWQWVKQKLGQNSLPCTKDEIKEISVAAPGPLKILEDSEATVKAFLDELSSSHIIHLACHGKQDPADPLKSALYLYNGPVELSHFMQKQHLQSPRLAFLSACETALGIQHLPNESIHLAASLTFVGFLSVVGTMWSIQDSDGPEIARHFYESLFEGLENSHAEWDSATALHNAVQKLRESGVSFMRWMPFIHFGI